MNFTNLENIRQHLESLQRDEHYTNTTLFKRIEFNKFYLEINAGVKALCEPRAMHDNLLHYKKIQISINEIVKGQEHAISPGTDDRFAGFDWLKYFTYTNTKGQVKPSYMGEMVPINEAISLIRDVYKVSRLKIFF